MVTHPLKDFIIKIRAGEQIYGEGDPGAEMFIVQSGSVRVFRSLPGGEQELAVMEKGDFFGEMSVLEGAARAASARALEDCELIEINSTVFDRMIRGNIEIAVRMLRKLSARLQRANRRIEAMAGESEEEAAAPGDFAPVPEPPEARVPAAAAAAPPSRESPAEVPGGESPTDTAIPFGPDWLGALILSDGAQVFPIRGESSLIGRYDPVTGTRPEIDLTAHDTNRSVSRRHAKLTARDGDLFVSEEVGALNGTFLNGKRLTPGKSESIQDGDTLALGMVTLRFQGRMSSS